jgi:hypothetical protein
MADAMPTWVDFFLELLDPEGSSVVKRIDGGQVVYEHQLNDVERSVVEKLIENKVLMFTGRGRQVVRVSSKK